MTALTLSRFAIASGYTLVAALILTALRLRIPAEHLRPLWWYSAGVVAWWTGWYWWLALTTPALTSTIALLNHIGHFGLLGQFATVGWLTWAERRDLARETRRKVGEVIDG